MRLVSNSVLCVIALTLAGCGHNGARPVIRTNNPVPVVNPKVMPMTLDNVQWRVMSLPELKALAAELERTGQTSAPFYILDQNGFETLTRNVTQMKRYIADQKEANDFIVSTMKINGQEASAPKEKPVEVVAPPPKKKIFGIF